MRITHKLLERELVELQKDYKYIECIKESDKMYRLYVNGRIVGDFMKLKEAYKTIQVLRDVVNLVERNLV